MNSGAGEMKLGKKLEDWPQFGLGYSFDEMERPSEITVFPDNKSSRVFTTWLTAPVEIAIPVEECR